MDMTGEYRIPAPRGKVWEALNDPDVLKICIPGCEELNKDSETELSAKVNPGPTWPAIVLLKSPWRARVLNGDPNGMPALR